MDSGRPFPANTPGRRDWHLHLHSSQTAAIWHNYCSTHRVFRQETQNSLFALAHTCNHTQIRSRPLFKLDPSSVRLYLIPTFSSFFFSFKIAFMDDYLYSCKAHLYLSFIFTVAANSTDFSGFELR